MGLKTKSYPFGAVNGKKAFPRLIQRLLDRALSQATTRTGIKRLKQDTTARSREIEPHLPPLCPRRDIPPSHAAGTRLRGPSTSVLLSISRQTVDDRDEPGHDSGE